MSTGLCKQRVAVIGLIMRYSKLRVDNVLEKISGRNETPISQVNCFVPSICILLRPIDHGEHSIWSTIDMSGVNTPAV